MKVNCPVALLHFKILAQQIRNYVFYVEEERGLELICTFSEVCVKICLYIMKKKIKDQISNDILPKLMYLTI